MKAIEFKKQNVVFAKDQKEYQPLPAYSQPNGLVTFCMQLDPHELEKVLQSGKLRLTVLTFGRPAQPIRVATKEPAFPVTQRGQFHCNPISWGAEPGYPATFEIDLFPINLQALKKTRIFWVTTATFGTPLQPVKLG